MINIKESISKLGPIETFDKNVFLENDKCHQNLCNFILSLALIWNDFKDILLFYEHIKYRQDQSPTDEKRITPLGGCCGSEQNGQIWYWK